jgi:hypothetical protein
VKSVALDLIVLRASSVVVAFVYGSVVVGVVVVVVVAVDSGADYEGDERQFVVDGGGDVAVEHRRFEMRSG